MTGKINKRTSRAREKLRQRQYWVLSHNRKWGKRKYRKQDNPPFTRNENTL